MNKKRIAGHAGWTSFNEWNKYTSQRSCTLTLQSGQSYYLEALMKEAAGNDHVSIGWAYEPPVALGQVDLGFPVNASWSEDNGTYSASVVSGDIWSSSDRCSTMLRAWSGDGEFIARITGMNNPYAWAKAGLTIRGGVAPNSQHASLLLTGANGMAFQRRRAVGGTSYHYGNGGKFDWVKLVRRGDVIESYLSADGRIWQLLATDTLAGFPSQIHIGFVAASNLAVSPVIATFSNFSASPLTATGVIPAAHLTSFSPDPADTNGDNLPDEWQALFPLNGTAYEKSEFADPDGDLLTNLEESQLGTDPLTPGGNQGHWLVEKWNSLPAYDVEDLVADPKYFSPADNTSLTSTWSFDVSPNQGGRRRAHLTAPESGEYVFWISARGAARLSISTDETKYAKRVVAAMGVQTGTGHGLRLDSPVLWDSYVSQMSKPVTLEAGKKYFVEFLTQNGHNTDSLHASIAWARPGSGREPLDTSFVSSYAQEAADADDDYLPDAWETQNGLNPLDNGFTDSAHQGENGDFDEDGLSNREEYLLGTNPSLVDTDGDGISDFTEAMVSGTDALVSNAPESTVVYSVNVLTHQGSNLAWVSTGSGIVADQFRGWIEWDFAVPQDGIWILDLATALRGTPRDGDTIAFDTSINGVTTGRKALTYGPAGENTLRLITPHLTQGTHRLRVNIDNMIARRTVEILSLKVLEPSGPDVESNGIVDWIEAGLLENDHVSSTAISSKTSPFCLEGHASVVSGVSVNGGGVYPGVDDNHWFTNLTLDPSLSTAYTATFSSGVTRSGEIAWETTDLLTSPAITIRLGDALKLGADFTEGSGDTTIAVGGQNYTVSGTLSAIHTFGTKGQFVVTASRSGATSQTVNVKVLGASFSSLPAIAENAATTWTLEKSAVDPDLAMQPGKGLRLGKYESISSTQFKRMLFPESRGRLVVAARVGEGGPIAAIAAFQAASFSDALQNDLTSTRDSPDFQDLYIVSTPMVFTNLPPGATIRVSIFRSGVTFLDGSTVMTFTESDLVNGILNLEFLYPKGAPGGYCHSVTILDPGGKVISTR